MALQATAGNAVVVQMLRQAHPGARQPAVQRSAVHDVLRTPGRPLDDATRTDMENRLGADFLDVRIHSDSAARASAAAVGARAYTSGRHVVIGDGGADRHTLAHELTHVIQQRRGPVAGTPTADGLSVSDPSDAFEREAEARATRALSGPPPQRTAPGESARRDTAAGQVQRVSAGADLAVQRLTIDDAPSSWTGQPVRRSGEGADGVFFVGPPGQEVVVKPMWATGNVEYAHRVLEHMNIQAPRIVRYALDSPEGQAIHDLLMSNQEAGRTPQEIETQLSTAQAFLVMEKAPGETLQGMPAAEALQYLGDQEALRQTGRIMVTDAFLGNDDRVMGGRVNLGNFLYKAATLIAPGALNAIDNNSKFTTPQVLSAQAGKKLDDKFQVKLTYLNFLRTPDMRDHFINKLLQKLRQAHRGSPEITGILDDDARTGPIKDRIGEGIAAAFADLAKVFADNVFLLQAIASYDEGGSAEDRSVTGAKAAAKYVADTQNGLTHDEAVEELIAYLERPFAKEKRGTRTVRRWLHKLAS
ncbi:eCIS core domain-containing protein [Streptomyces sp. MAR4 CNY-716]